MGALRFQKVQTFILVKKYFGARGTWNHLKEFVNNRSRQKNLFPASLKLQLVREGTSQPLISWFSSMWKADHFSGQNNTNLFVQNLHKYTISFPVKRLAIILDPQHDCPDITCKPAIIFISFLLLQHIPIVPGIPTLSKLPTISLISITAKYLKVHIMDFNYFVS